MAKSFLKVTLPDGTEGKRQTARKYTHAVVMQATPDTWKAKAQFERELAQARTKEAAKYQRYVDLGDAVPEAEYARPRGLYGSDSAHDWDVKCHKEYLADGSFQQWVKDCTEYAADHRAEAEKYEAMVANNEYGKWVVVSWHHSSDLAARAVDKECLGLPGKYLILETHN